MPALRQYQENALSRSLSSYQRGINRQLLVMATGLGKTAVAAALRDHHGFRRKILFLVHMETLAAQAADKFAAWNPGLMVGVEMANRRSAPFDTFVVASVPTIGRKNSERLRKFDPSDFDAIIQDEAHIGVADTFKRVYDHFGLLEPNPSGPLFLGITATPNRADGQGLKSLFDVIVFDMGIQDGIGSGWLCDLRALRIKTNANLDKVHTRAGDLAQDELEKEVNTPKRNALIVKEWYKHAVGRRTLAFTVDVQHALDLAEAFRQHGARFEAVWGDDPDRQDKILRYKNGELDGICNCMVLGIGFDDPLTSCIIPAAPTKSFVKYAQQIGRGTRIADGKEDCLILDPADNCTRHNLCTISSLLGLPKELDLKGEKYSKAKEQLERVAKEFPTANLQDVKNLDQLKSIAEHVSLFQVSYPPEISRMTELTWRKSGEGYVLAVGRDLVSINKDLRDEFQVRGNIAGNKIDLSSQNLPGAFNQADRAIIELGGEKRLLAREARWRNDEPTPAQIGLCRKLGLAIPAGANKGMVSAAIDAKLRERRMPHAALPEERGGNVGVV